VNQSALRRFFGKWGLCLLMMAATTLIYLDRQAVALLAPSIQQELGIDNAGLGWVFSVFYYAYTLAQFGVGLLLDRYSLRWLYGGAIVAWAAAATLTGLAQSFAMLLAFRMLLAVLESGNWPGAMRIVSRALPPSERALGNGIFTSGTSIGALLAPALILGVSGLVGWRASFAALGALGVVWFVAWWWFTRDPKLTTVWRDERSAKAATGWPVYRNVLRQTQFWKVFAITVLVNPILYFFLNWLPLYYKQQHGIGQGAELAKILTLTFLGLDLGYLGCGACVLLLMRRGGLTLRSARRTVMAAATVLLAGAGLVPAMPSFSWVVTFLVLAVFAAGVWIAMYLTLAQEVSPASVSTAAGLLGGSGSFAGAILMWAVGWITQTTGSFALPLYTVSAMAVLAGFAGWAASRKEPSV
jgi:ACS family hexuronate transporter-like MFS transporter